MTIEPEDRALNNCTSRRVRSVLFVGEIKDGRLDLICGTYVGDMNKNGVPHGIGRFMLHDGSSYKGSWISGKLDFQKNGALCTIEVKKGSVVIARHGSEDGYGTAYIFRVNGTIYHGGIKFVQINSERMNYIRHGKGGELTTKGKRISGEWKDDVQIGYAVMEDKGKFYRTTGPCVDGKLQPFREIKTAVTINPYNRT